MMMNLELFDGTWAARAPVSDASLDASSVAFGAAPAILAAATALPPNVIEQESIATLLKALWGDKYDQSRRWRSTFEQIQRSVRIDRRYLALPVSESPALDSFAKTIASALFGDGAAAVLLGGAHLANRGGGIPPRVIATRSVFYPDSEGMMGWEVVDSGFKIVLSPAIPDLVREHLGGDVDAMLTENGLARSAISHWIAHTGGNRVPQAVATARGPPPAAPG